MPHTTEHRAATRRPLTSLKGAGPRAPSSLRAGWQCLEMANRRIDNSWIGDLLGGVALAVMAVGLIWGAALAQAVMQ